MLGHIMTGVVVLLEAAALALIPIGLFALGLHIIELIAS